ncbi:peptidoglycan-binding protein [Luteimonas viscosa]|uniref:Peptidoglycan-binding protein n=1 Tax=Luteimonas viscosa TaxID=1132694 RepID=A0A5D4XRG8_9GAMM|nr:peptidoglycan-binding domain-containing protein [Luteimonas viscosa]TYT25542.1 peptidoglycan-binding protein [Luteimonas viscosa]
MSNGPGTAYTVRQFVFDERGARNEDVTGFEDLVTHHPRANADAQMADGEILGVERPATRSHAFIGGAYQEVETARTDEYGTLKQDQVLLIKDFILERDGRRQLDVPSPIAGHVGRVDRANGLVELLDRRGGEVVARVRHLNPIAVAAGDDVAYGDSLGTQNNQGLRLAPGTHIHVHIEMDTRHYQNFRNYVDDLASGRLAVEAAHRAGVTAQPVIDDATFRLGESGEPVATVQRALVADGYRAAGDRPIAIDGVYRPDMQGALLAFQQDHRIPRTGDIDPATVQLALRVNLDRPLGPLRPAPDPDLANAVPQVLRDVRQGLDPAYTVRPWQPLPDAGHPVDPARTQRAPVHHAHPGHAPARLPERAPDPAHPGHPDHALLLRIRAGVRGLDRAVGKDWDTASERLGASLLAKAKECGFSGRDEIALVLNDATATLPAGALVHMERRGPYASADPAANWTHVRTADAVATPCEDSYRKAEALAGMQAATSPQGHRAIESTAVAAAHQQPHAMG